MITCMILPGNDNLVSVSPFCLKVLYFLDLMGVEYKTRVSDPRKTPRGKLPCIDDDGTIVADSANIIRHVEDKTGRSLFEPEDPTALAHGRAALRIAEDSFYWTVVYAQFLEDDGWEHHQVDVAKVLPSLLRPLLIGVVRKATLKQLHGAGVGRLPPEEVYRRGGEDLDTFEGLLGDKPFIAGDEPSVYDLSPWSNLACLYSSQDHISKQARAMLDARPGVRAWIGRLEAKARERKPAEA